MTKMPTQCIDLLHRLQEGVRLCGLRETVEHLNPKCKYMYLTTGLYSLTPFNPILNNEKMKTIKNKKIENHIK